MRDRVKALVELIEALDGLRVGRYASADRLERVATELGLRLPYSWEELRGDIEGILALPAASPEYGKLERMDRLATLLLRANLSMLLAAIAAYLLRWFVGGPLLEAVALLALVGALVTVNLAYSLKVYVAVRVGAIYAERAGDLEKLGRRIKATVEYLLRQLRRELVSRGYDLSAFTLKLWMPDYSGVRVVKKPGRLSARYVVRLA